MRNLAAFTALAFLTLGSSLTGCEQKSQVMKKAPMSPIEKICSRAFSGREGSHEKTLKALTPEQQAQVQALPDKEAFIKACADLPEDAARCLDPNILMNDLQACKTAFEAAPKDKFEAMNKLLNPTAEPEKTSEEPAEAEAEAAEATE